MLLQQSRQDCVCIQAGIQFSLFISIIDIRSQINIQAVAGLESIFFLTEKWE